jgi:hypothetical protein
LISASKLSKRWLNWNNGFWERVKIEEEKNKKYQKELVKFRREKKKTTRITFMRRKVVCVEN